MFQQNATDVKKLEKVFLASDQIQRDKIAKVESQEESQRKAREIEKRES